MKRLRMINGEVKAVDVIQCSECNGARFDDGEACPKCGHVPGCDNDSDNQCNTDGDNA